MLKYLLLIALLCALVLAQQPKPSAPPMKVNILNVCTPTPEEEKEFSAALVALPSAPRFSADYEVARGHTTVEGPPSDWVRIRRDLKGNGRWTAAQYLFSATSNDVREVTVFFSRETKGVTQVALEDKITPAAPPASVLAANTPVNRISLERFGKPHLVLARCPDVDQSAYEPLFRSASGVMAAYRAALDAREIVTGEIGRQSLFGSDGRRPPRVKPLSPRK